MPPDKTPHAALLEQLPTALRKLARLGKISAYPRKTLLLDEHEAGDALYIVLKGRVRLFSSSGTGREVTYCMVEPGDYFGELSLDGGPRAACAVTVDSTVCVEVKFDDVRRYMDQEPGWAQSMLMHSLERSRLIFHVARQMALLKVSERLIAWLEQQPCEANAGGSTTQLGQSTHAEIAGWIGASREMVSRLLKDFVLDGTIQMKEKQITLLKGLPRPQTAAAPD